MLKYPKRINVKTGHNQPTGNTQGASRKREEIVHLQGAPPLQVTGERQANSETKAPSCWPRRYPRLRQN